MASEIELLTKRIEELEAKFGSSAPKPKRTRKPSEYAIFMGDYMKKNKDDKKTHKVLFAEAVAAWNKQKK
jgi:hypothetical protein